MVEILDSTISRIHQEAKREFLEKGFKSASLRNIVKSLGMTTGAFYGYYKSKEELFEALVEEEYRYVIDSLVKTLHSIKGQPLVDQLDNMEKIARNHLMDVLHYGYSRLDEFKLLLLCADGTKYENILDKLVEVQTVCSDTYKQEMEIKGIKFPIIDKKLEHVLVTGMFSTFSELFIHELPIEKAEDYLNNMLDFYMAGWKKILSNK